MVSGGAGDLINTESSGQQLSHLAITITIVSTHKGLTWERNFFLLLLFCKTVSQTRVFCLLNKLPKFALALPYNSWCNEPNIRKIGSDISRLSNEPIVHAYVNVSVGSDENLFDI